MSILFAATYPERVSSLILGAATARYRWAPDYPCGRGSDAMLDSLESISAHRWGQGATIDWFLPSRADSPGARRMFARFERMAVSPSAFLRIIQMVRDIDVRAVLPAIHVPTLVIQRLNDIMTPPCHGRYLASHIAGAATSSSPGTTPCDSPAAGTSTGSSARSRTSSLVHRIAAIRTACSPRSCSPRWRTAPRTQIRPATVRRLATWMPGVPRSASECAHTADGCVRAPHGASSPPSTRPGKQSGPQQPSAMTLQHTESSYAPGFTPGKWTWSVTRSGASALTSSAVLPPVRSLPRSSYPEPSKTWSLVPGSRSPAAARTN